jgi:hypothetical protein
MRERRALKGHTFLSPIQTEHKRRVGSRGDHTENSYLYTQTAGMATGCRLDDRGVGVRVTVGSRIFPSPGSFSTIDRWRSRCKGRFYGPPLLPALGSTQPRIQWVPGGGGSFPGVVKLTTHLQLVPRSRKHGSTYTSTPPYAFMA